MTKHATRGGAAPAAGALYSVSEVARLFEVPESRLRYWSQTGFLAPSQRQRGRLRYTFRDLVSIKVAVGLLNAGLSLQRVRRSLDALRLRLPAVDDPLATLRVQCERDRVVVVTDEGNYDAATGQLVLDFELAALQRQVAQVVALPGGAATVDPAETDTAYGWYRRAREIEGRPDPDGPSRSRQAELQQAYEHALELDPDFAPAWTNLGSLLAEQGQLDRARDHFDHALRCDPDQPEARLNLAELALREGDPEVAVAGFREVLSREPDSVEAHYGLARALLELGGQAQALAHLERFCAAVDRLEPHQRDGDLERRRRRAAEAVASLRTASPPG
ncbi:MAG: tetratricopeptide repeat protein [Myxococcales bacterium FL481]|nr:MAG: tetratricopeptide repeat protein [Myxococcales bacterium FL481]